MTSDVPGKLLQQLETATSEFHIEDILFNGILAEKANVSLQHNKGTYSVYNFYAIWLC